MAATEHPAAAGPEQMRAAMAGYIAAVHDAYLAQAALLSPGDRARLPLLAPGQLTVAAIGAGRLHVVATFDPLPPPQGPEVAIDGSSGPLRWTVRFYDPVVLPALGLLDERDGARPDDVRRALGIQTFVFHLVVQTGAQLGGHHAMHAGTGLANAHSAAARDFEAIRAHAHGRERLVDELAAAAAAGLPIAQGLLAKAIASPPDPDALRRALLAAVRPVKSGRP